MSGDRADRGDDATAVAVVHRRPASTRAIIALVAIGGLVVLASSLAGLPEVTRMTSDQWREFYVFSALVFAVWLRPVVHRCGRAQLQG